MGPETYYFYLSIVLVLGIVVHITNMAYFRVKSKTIFGKEYKTGTLEHRRLSRSSGTLGMTIAITLGILFVANLVFDVNRLLNLDDKDYAHAILVYAPISSVLFFAFALFIAQKIFKDFFPTK